MDASRFDALTRNLSSRRTVLTGLAGGGSTTLTREGATPAWSPDGSEIVFQEWDSIATMSAGGGDTTKLTEGWDPDW